MHWSTAVYLVNKASKDWNMMQLFLCEPHIRRWGREVSHHKASTEPKCYRALLLISTKKILHKKSCNHPHHDTTVAQFASCYHQQGSRSPACQQHALQAMQPSRRSHHPGPHKPCAGIEQQWSSYQERSLKLSIFKLMFEPNAFQGTSETLRASWINQNSLKPWVCFSRQGTAVCCMSWCLRCGSGSQQWHCKAYEMYQLMERRSKMRSITVQLGIAKATEKMVNK